MSPKKKYLYSPDPSVPDIWPYRLDVNTTYVKDGVTYVVAKVPTEEAAYNGQLMWKRVDKAPKNSKKLSAAKYKAAKSKFVYFTNDKKGKTKMDFHVVLESPMVMTLVITSGTRAKGGVTHLTVLRRGKEYEFTGSKPKNGLYDLDDNLNICNDVVYDGPYENSYFLHGGGCSQLFRLSKGKYLFVGVDIYTFTSTSRIDCYSATVDDGYQQAIASNRDTVFILEDAIQADIKYFKGISMCGIRDVISGEIKRRGVTVETKTISNLKYL